MRRRRRRSHNPLVLLALAGCTAGAPGAVEAVSTTVVELGLREQAIGTWSCVQSGEPDNGLKYEIEITDGAFDVTSSPASEQPAEMDPATKAALADYVISGTWDLDGMQLSVSGVWGAASDGPPRFGGEYVLESDQVVSQDVQIRAFGEDGADPQPRSGETIVISNVGDSEWSFVINDVERPDLERPTQTCKKA